MQIPFSHQEVGSEKKNSPAIISQFKLLLVMLIDSLSKYMNMVYINTDLTIFIINTLSDDAMLGSFKKHNISQKI